VRTADGAASLSFRTCHVPLALTVSCDLAAALRRALCAFSLSSWPRRASPRDARWNLLLRSRRSSLRSLGFPSFEKIKDLAPFWFAYAA